MPLIIGTDEAGYGPNLGPLVVTATVWRVADPDVPLHDVLSDAVCLPADTEPRLSEKIFVGDSKQLFSSQGSLRLLEESVLAILASGGWEPRTLAEILLSVNSTTPSGCWPIEPSRIDNLPLPCESDRNDVTQRAAMLTRVMEQCKVELLTVKSSVVFPSEFNVALKTHGNKSSALSAITLELVRQSLVAGGEDEQVKISCDKHGGRNKYAALLQHFVTDEPVMVVGESLEHSEYRWQNSTQEFSGEFLARGESRFEIAVASMVSKYIRELTMIVWNEFWKEHVPNLKRTAGYPVDARRFKRDIETVQQSLGIRDEEISRER